MKITITGGQSEAVFIVSMFKKEKHDLIVINEDIDVAKNISENNDINVYYGDPAKPHILENANVKDSDILISLCDEDTDNYVICQLGKRMFNVKKCICIVQNPKNVDTFKKLGIDSVISSTYLLYQTIKGESEIESLVKTLSLENERIVISEIVIKEDYNVANKQLKELNLPVSLNISCILREPDIIIPDGLTTIMPNDKLVIVCKKENLESVINYFKERVVHNAG